MIEVSVDSIRVSLMSAHRIVVLKEIGSERYLPIWIGPYEAEAIAMRLRDMEVQRPLTHDLLFNVIGEMGGEISRIVVTELHDNTFFARIGVQVGHETLDIDSRPSDALALAVRAEVPIYVADEVMAEAGITPQPDVGEDSEDEELSAFRDFINTLDLDDLPLQ
ncbi:MAG: bifunctional nuclease family protein [Chloroflexi bacterium]|nr:bifunctional nuclease family protein [Chloroflexota bacterium]